jgi:hypothetical protein
MNSSTLKAVAAILEFRVANPARSQKADINAVARILSRHRSGTSSDAILEQATRMESALIGVGLLPR